MQVDNTTINNYVCNNLEEKKSKLFDMQLHWLCDRINNSQFEIYWMKGEFNYADYYSKHHTVAHHKKMCPLYLVLHIVHKYTNKKRTTSAKLSTNTICHS